VTCGGLKLPNAWFSIASGWVCRFCSTSGGKELKNRLPLALLVRMSSEALSSESKLQET